MEVEKETKEQSESEFMLIVEPVASKQTMGLKLRFWYSTYDLRLAGEDSLVMLQKGPSAETR
jgi:hypothetical protein